jgi:hypothetical protein
VNAVEKFRRVATGLGGTEGPEHRDVCGTGYFADPQAKLVVVFGTAIPGDGNIRGYHRQHIQNLVYGAMIR